MRLPWLAGGLSLLVALGQAKPWSFDDATLTVSRKGAGVGGGSKEKLNPSSSLSPVVALKTGDTLKISITTTEDKSPKRPHQAFLTLQDTSTGIEDAFPFNTKENGKGKIELTHKDLPAQFLADSPKPLKAHIILASFGSSSPFDHHAFDLAVSLDQETPMQLPEKPMRYGKLDEIHHIFRTDPKSPPKLITLVFVLAAVAPLPLLIAVWAVLGANLNHLPHAFSNAPVSHAAFLGSVMALEGIFFLYYSHWRLYQMLPAAGAAGLVAFLSGSRALSEVQGRRMIGKR